jgi:hypothetical protein
VSHVTVQNCRGMVRLRTERSPHRNMRNGFD